MTRTFDLFFLSDFKYFLIGELDEEPKEGDEEEGEEEKKEGEEKADEEKTEGQEEAKEQEEEKKEERPDETEEKKEEVAEKPKEPPKPSPTMNRKSILWGYMKASTNVIETAKEMKDKNEAKAAEQQKADEAKKAEEAKIKEDIKEEKNEKEDKKEDKATTSVTHSKHDSGIGSEIESEAEMDTTTGVISVTVKHLHSITEEKMGDEDVFEEVEADEKSEVGTPHSRRTSRPQSSVSHRTRPLSGVTTASLDSDGHMDSARKESEKAESRPISASKTESSRPISASKSESRPPSAGQRPISAMSRPTSASHRTPSAAVSRVSSSRLSTHSERDYLLDDTTDTMSIDLDIQDDDGDDEEFDRDPDTFREPLSERQVKHIEHFAETRAYSEVPSRTDIIYTEPNYCNYKDPKDSFQRFPRREGASHILERAKSASRIQTIRKLESAILRRQNTDSKLNLESIREANSQKKEDPVKTNINGMTCKHINIDLDFRFQGPSARYESYSRELLRRPKTALSFNERCSQLAKERLLQRELRESEEPFVSIIDLTRRLNRSSTGYPENPDLPLKHSGYKSVWPLARVKSARNMKVNQGKNIELNSISRRLERTPIAWSSEPETTGYNIQKGFAGRTNRNQAVITLQIPNLANSSKGLKRMSPLSGLLPRAKLRG